MSKGHIHNDEKCDSQNVKKERKKERNKKERNNPKKIEIPTES